jgi:hypothetical protein
MAVPGTLITSNFVILYFCYLFIELGAFYYMHFTIPIVKCSFFNIFFHTFLNEHFTIGIVKNL